MTVTTLPPPITLPRRDPEARARLGDAARRGAPLVLARERVLPVAGALGAHLRGATIQRGAVVTIGGVVGAGATSAALDLAAAATAAGEWAAAVELGATLGGLAAHESGVELSRFALVRDVPRDRWAAVVAVLLEGVSVVLAEVPRGARASDARRLMARARERAVVLVLLTGSDRAWPAEATLRVHVEGGGWSGLEHGGALVHRTPALRVEGRAARPVALEPVRSIA